MKVLYKTTSHQKFEVSTLDHDHVDEVFLSLDPDQDEISDFLKINKPNRPSVDIINKSYQAMQQSLSLTYDELLKSVPRSHLMSGMKSVIDDLEAALETAEDKEYLVTYLTIKRFLRSLSRPFVDQSRLARIIESTEHEGVAKRMTELAPEKDGQARKTSYCMTGSTTGRLTVDRGPNILTIKSSARKALKSRYRNGKILQIDLSAAEPNIALNVMGKEFKGDVYDHISQKVLAGKVTRDHAKLITLSSLYGQSAQNLKKILPENVRPYDVISKTKDFFEASSLEKMLVTSFRNSNLRNVVGRPIRIKETDTRLLISYYLQSSAAELAIVMFSEWVKEQQGLVPLYVIHDALIADCDEKLSFDLMNKRIINLEIGSWKFKAKVSLVA